MVRYADLAWTPAWHGSASPAAHIIFLFFLQTTFVHYSFTIKKARHIQNYGQDFINHIFPLMGGTPYKGLLYNNCYLNSNDLGVIIFQNLGCLVFVCCAY